MNKQLNSKVKKIVENFSHIQERYFKAGFVAGQLNAGLSIEEIKKNWDKSGLKYLEGADDEND